MSAEASQGTRYMSGREALFIGEGQPDSRAPRSGSTITHALSTRPLFHRKEDDCQNEYLAWSLRTQVTRRFETSGS
jgi:hypothetical protein